MATVPVEVEVPEAAFSALRRSPKEFAREMRIAAAILWYHQGLVSQGKAAEIAGLSRADFLDAPLFRANIPAGQVTAEELKEELESWQRLSARAGGPPVRPGPARSVRGPSTPAPAARTRAGG